MNDWLVRLGIEHWKPALQTLLVLPMPMLLLGLLAWALVGRWPRLSRALGLLSVLLTWALSTPWAAHQLQQQLTRPPPPLAPAQLRALVSAPHTAILVLGAGRRPSAPDYGAPDGSTLTLARLRYGWWLARQTGLPLAYSGGVGHGAAPGPTEAEVAQLVTARDHGVPIRWVEQRSRDTNENAVYSVAMLQAEGITQVLLVTNNFHQQRALAAFARAIARSGKPMQVVPAAMGQRPPLGGGLGDYLPGYEGLAGSGWALHEWLGWLAGA